MQRGNETKQHSRNNGEAYQGRSHTRIDVNVVGERQIQVKIKPQQVNAARRQSESERRAGESEHQALREELLHQAYSVRADGAANGDLAAASRGA